jgi:WD40 repeat protein
VKTDYYGDPLPERAVARLGTVRLRHARHINAVAFFPDGKTLVSGGADQVVSVWDMATGGRRQRLEGHKGPVNCLAVAADGRLLASGGGDPDTCIRLWDAVTGAPLRRLQPPKEVYHVRALAFAPDGKTLAEAADDRTIRLWDLATGQSRLFAQVAAVTHLSFSGDGQYLLALGVHDQPHVWTVATAKVPDWLARQKIRLASAGFTADGKMLVVAAGRAVRWLGLTPGKEIRRERWTVEAHIAQTVVPRPPLTEAQKDDQDVGYEFGTFSPNGKLLLRRGANLRFRDSATGKEVMTIAEVPRLEATAFAPDTRHFAAGSQAGVVLVWDLPKWQRLPERGHLGSVQDVVFLQGGTLLATVSADHSLRLWDAVTGKELRRPPGPSQGMKRIAPFQGGTGLVVTGHDHTIRLYDAARDKELRRFAIKEGLHQAIASPDGKVLAVVTSPAIQLRDAQTGAALGAPLSHPDSIYNPVFRADGKVLAVGVRGGGVYLWDVAAGKRLRVLPGGTGTAASVAFSPDGTLLAAGYGDRRIRMWDPETGERLRELTAHTAWVNALAFSPDGKRLASGSSDRTVLLWDTATLRAGGPEPAPVARLLGHQSDVFAVAFSPDGRRLASGSADTTALVWDLGW